MAKCKFTGFAPDVARPAATPTWDPLACSGELPRRAAARLNGANPAEILWRHAR